MSSSQHGFAARKRPVPRAALLLGMLLPAALIPAALIPAALLLAACHAQPQQPGQPAPPAQPPSAEAMFRLLERPEGAGPFPAVVLLHGCGGIMGVQRAWGERLRSWGYVTLIVDSFGPRGVRTRCGYGPVGAGNVTDRVDDAFAALAWLQQQPFVIPDRIAVMGWSMGGGVTLRSAAQGEAERRGVPPERRFRAAVAFYPGCASLKAYDPPLLILVGDADDWTPAERCRRFAAGRYAGGVAVELKVYPGATHAFDSTLPARVFLGHALRYDAAATADAAERVRAFLGRTL